MELAFGVREYVLFTTGIAIIMMAVYFLVTGLFALRKQRVSEIVKIIHDNRHKCTRICMNLDLDVDYRRAVHDCMVSAVYIAGLLGIPTEEFTKELDSVYKEVTKAFEGEDNA